MRIILLASLMALAFAKDDSSISKEASFEEEPTLVVPQRGDICNIAQGLREAEVENQFFECIIPTQDPSAWAWPQLGIWERKNCTIGYLFSPLSESCRNETSLRRQQPCGFGGCGGGQQQVVQPQQSWGQPQPWYQQSGGGGGCGPQGCGQSQAWQPQPQPAWQPQPQQQQWSPCGAGGCPQVQPMPQPQPWQPPPQPQPQPWSPCGAQGCPQVQPVQPMPMPMPMPAPAPSPCGVQGCPQPRPSCGQPAQPRCPTPCGQPSCPRPVVKKPCPQASGGGCGQQGCGGGGGGGYCSWMLERLRQGQGTGYMQCTPVPNRISEYCGQWKPRKCGYGTKFNVRAQVCIRDPNVRPRPGPSCPQRQIPIGPCNAQRQCPGFSKCQQPTNTCCQRAQWSG